MKGSSIIGKIYKMSKTSNTKNIISGIYKITFPNGKCYIGLSNNIRKRIWTHNRYDYKKGFAIGKAIKKYGIITEFEVLEEISPRKRKLMGEREKYWIQYYNSNNYKYGYNRTKGGEGLALDGVNNGHAAFNEKQLNQIYDLLTNHKEISMKQIAQEYNVAPTTIRSINTGKTYYQENLTYPIRTKEESNKNLLTGIKSTSAKLNEKQIAQIIELIINSDKTFKAISDIFQVNITTISLINRGKRYYNPLLVYPLRSKQKIKEIQYKKQK